MDACVTSFYKSTLLAIWLVLASNRGDPHVHDVVHGHNFFHDERLGIIDAHQVAIVLTLSCDAVHELSPSRIKLCNIKKITRKL